MGSLIGNTVLTHPETGTPVSLLKGQEIPDWAEGLVGDHLMVGNGSDAAATASGTVTPDQKPPTSGKGSGLEAWQKYATDNGIAYPEDANRDEIIAAVDAHDQ